MTATRRIKKRHMASGTVAALAIGLLVEWADIAPGLCPVLPLRVAKALCAPSLITLDAVEIRGAADGGTP